jgi:hypothetical protein
VTTCHCGQPLHYSDPDMKRAVEAIIRVLGEYTLVKIGGRAWRVQRHYIALHGLKAVELPFLGFEEVKA